MAEPASRRRIVACPTCKGDSLFDVSNPFRPFCSERCKNIDFGSWADEGFRVPAAPEPDESPQGPHPLQ